MIFTVDMFIYTLGNGCHLAVFQIFGNLPLGLTNKIKTSGVELVRQHTVYSW